MHAVTWFLFRCESLKRFSVRFCVCVNIFDFELLSCYSFKHWKRCSFSVFVFFSTRFYAFRLIRACVARNPFYICERSLSPDNIFIWFVSLKSLNLFGCSFFVLFILRQIKRNSRLVLCTQNHFWKWTYSRSVRSLFSMFNAINQI